MKTFTLDPSPLYLLLPLVLVAGACLPAMGQGDAPPQQIDLSTVPVVLVDEVAIPIPREIFISLDKLGSPGWKQYLRGGEISVPTSRSELALLFGLVISNGFVAVEAEDTERVTEIGRDVLRLATALGVRQSVVMHTQSIVENSRAGQWNTVRRELDRAQESVRRAMRELRDDDVAYLVSVGGWLGGTEVLASVLNREYSAEGSDLLNQPDLLEQIADRFRALPNSIRDEPLMQGIEDGLTKLRPLLEAGPDGAVSQTAVAQVFGIASSLVNSVYGEGIKRGGGGG